VRIGTLLGETRRDITSGTARVGLGFWALALVLILLSLADLLTISRLQTDAQHYQAAGAATRALVAKRSVAPAVCDALARTSSVAASGAMADGQAVRFSAMPTVAIQTYRVTPGFAGVLGIDPAPGGVWMDDGLAGVLGVRVGAVLPTDRGNLLVTGVFAWPQDGRDQRLSFAVLTPEALTGSFDECWLRAWPTQDANDLLLREAQKVRLDNPNPGMIGQVNTSLGTTLDSHGLYMTRLTQYVPLVLLVAGFALGYALARARRLQYASALHAGQAKSEQLLSCLLQTAAWAVPAAFVAGVGCWVAVVVVGVPGLMTALPIVLRGPALGLCGALLGAFLGCLLTREKHLFRLFKTR